MLNVLNTWVDTYPSTRSIRQKYLFLFQQRYLVININ